MAKLGFYTKARECYQEVESLMTNENMTDPKVAIELESIKEKVSLGFLRFQKFVGRLF